MTNKLRHFPRRVVIRVLERVWPRLLWRFRAAAWTPDGSEPELVLLRSLCDRGKVSVDVGASLGVYTMNMLGYSRACYAFEPRPDQADRLRQEFRGCRPPVSVEAVALSDRDGTARLRICPADTGRSTMEARNQIEEFAEVETVPVPMRRLDSFEYPSIGCIKIDVEGHEEAVLRGARETLIRDRPQLIVECEERHNPGAIQRVRRFLEELGYRGFFFWNGWLEPIESFDVEIHQTAPVQGAARRVSNFVFLIPDRVGRIRRWFRR